MTRRTVVNLGLLAAMLALFVVPLVLHLGVGSTPAGQAYGGTDTAAQGTVERVDPGYRPWFESFFTPSPEVESGLFALQAALGAGALGFALGRLSARRGPRAASPAAVPAADGEGTG